MSSWFPEDWHGQCIRYINGSQLQGTDMKLNLNLGHGLAQQQQLNLAPQLLQWLRLLQAPAQHLEQLVRHELDTNPALEELEEEERAETDDEFGEEGEEGLLDESAEPELMDERMEILAELGREWDQDETSASCDDIAASQERMDYRMNTLTESSSMRDQLMKQVAVMGLPGPVKAAAELIIGTLDSRGYLDVSMETLAEESGMEAGALQQALKAVQGCEPVGVGARDLKECLLLQLPAGESGTALARRLVEHHIEAVAQNRLAAIAEHIDMEMEEIEEAVRLIRSLNPYPGQALAAGEPVCAVTPDVVIRENEEGGFEIEIVERNVPRLRISHSCRALIEKGNLSRGDLAYVRSRIRSAMFVIEGLRKREATMRRITEEIVRIQHRYLRGEETEIRPLTMAKVAAIIGVHDTTVSRALAEKFVDTPVGVFPLKHFFQAGYQCQDGSALTPDMVRQRIHHIIQREDPAEPIKDEDIAEILQKDGIPVARRTVAKYRGELGVGSSKERLARGPARVVSAIRPPADIPADAEELEPALYA